MYHPARTKLLRGMTYPYTTSPDFRRGLLGSVELTLT